MPAVIRLKDATAIFNLAGECRELGDDRDVWRLHFVERLARLVDADMGYCGEAQGNPAAGELEDLGVSGWGQENWVTPAVFRELAGMIAQDQEIYGARRTYLEKLAHEDGACHSRREIIIDNEWYNSTSYQIVNRSMGMDHTLLCFRSIPNGPGRAFSGVVLYRAIGRRDFGPYDRAIVREVQLALAPLVGGPLARFSDPSPLDLAPRVRQVLGCLLEGDGDKQIAAGLKLSIYTINQYTKVIFRHFGVNSRPELLARWVRRGSRNGSPWLR
jgi:DNA-binding CsgD family transcriptional regulator